MLISPVSTLFKIEREVTLPIIELVAYAIIGLSCLLFVGGAVFLMALNAYESLENWRVERKVRKGSQNRAGANAYIRTSRKA